MKKSYNNSTTKWIIILVLVVIASFLVLKIGKWDIETATFIALALTLIALVFYVQDTGAIAKVTLASVNTSHIVDINVIHNCTSPSILIISLSFL